MTKADLNLISGSLATPPSFRQVTVSELISVKRGRQSQSGFSVWATALMWQIWERRRVRDRRGTQLNSEARGLMPNQDWETGSVPLTHRPSTQPPLSTWNTRRSRQWQRWQLAYFHHSLPVCLHQNQWVCSFLLVYLYMWVAGPGLFVSVSFIHKPSTQFGCICTPLPLSFCFTFDLSDLTWLTVVQ